MSPDEQFFKDFLARYRSSDSTPLKIGVYPFSWLGQVSASILYGQETEAAFEWAEKMSIQLRRMPRRTPFKIIHCWHFRVMKSLSPDVFDQREGFSADYEKVEELHRYALDGGRTSSDDWLAFLKPLLYEIYRCAYPRRVVLNQSYAEALEESLARSAEKAQAEKFARAFSETNASINSQTFSEANATANAQALGAAYSAANAEAYALTMPFARIGACAAAYTGQDSADRENPVSGAFYQKVANELLAALEQFS